MIFQLTPQVLEDSFNLASPSKRCLAKRQDELKAGRELRLSSRGRLQGPQGKTAEM